MTDVTTGAIVDPDAAECLRLAETARAGAEVAFDASIELGRRLVAVRARMPANVDFGAWCKQYNHFGFQRDWLSKVQKASLYCDNTTDAPRNVDACAKAQRALERAAEHEQLALTPIPDPTTLGVFPIVYVDPPWRYDFAAQPNRAIENQYPTMSAEELAALQVPAADDCVLLMWATSPKLVEALDLMAAWGFEYKTNMVWVKDRIGMGYYARQRHELLLIGRRGEGLVPHETSRPDSVLEAPRGAHSAKPHEMYDLIDTMWPGLPKVELFARNTREGWTSWGNQA